MKAKPTKMKTAAKATTSKPVSKHSASAKTAKPVKTEARRSADVKAKATAKTPAKTAFKTAPKGAAKTPAKGASKPVPKAPLKAASKVAGKPAQKVVPKFAKLSLGTKGAKAGSKESEVPRPKPRPAPKPASVATRRKERQSFRDLLVKKRQDLMTAYMTSKGDSQSDLDNGTEDYVDYAVNSYAREFLLSLTELDRKQLLLVEDALARIDRGEYGYCQQCGEDIAVKRLEVQPWARHCVRCQELEEKGLLPQYPFSAVEEEETAEEPEESVVVDEEFEPDTEVEDELIDEEPLVVDGEDSDD